MKHVFTCIILTAFMGTSAAYHRQQGSELNLQLYGRGDFNIVLNGVNYPWIQNGFQVGHLSPGNHYLKIVETVKHAQHQGNRGNHYGHSHQYKRVVYHGHIHIPYQARVWARLMPNQQLNIYRIEPMSLGFRSNPGGICRNMYGDCLEHDHNYDARRGGSNEGYADETWRDNHNWSGQGNGARWDNGHDQSYTHQDNFRSLKRAISNTSFDSDKLIIANQYIKLNTIGAAEVAEIMRLFSYEHNRLTFAKNAYEACHDKQNYFLVNQAFMYSNSIRQLQAFIQ